MEKTILKMRGISKSFVGVKALDQVELELKKGEIHALIGENGAGKSTLMKILIGIHRPDEGTIEFNGNQVDFKNPANALKAGISMIHQEISLVMSMSVAENIWLGREHLFKKLGLINGKKRAQMTGELLDKVGLSCSPDLMVKELSVAEMQMVELARAISYNANIIIMDEPTSALTNKEIEKLYEITRELAAKGVTIIFISHKIEEIFAICESITVLRDGKYIGKYRCDELDHERLIHLIVGRNLEQIYERNQAINDEVVLKVEGLSRQGVFQNVSFELKKGEILGFSGLMGAGRTEIMRAIFGMDRYDTGSIVKNGKRVTVQNPKDAVNQGIGMVTEDRLRTGAIYTMSVMDNGTLASMERIANKAGLFSKKKETQEFSKVSQKLILKCASFDELIGNLSGGNQQKVIITRWLLRNVDVLIMDEPTRGIDIGSKAEIYKLMDQMTNEGISILLVSSEMPELMGMSDRILVVANGQIVFESKRGEFNQEELMMHAFGLGKTGGNNYE